MSSRSRWLGLVACSTLASGCGDPSSAAARYDRAAQALFNASPSPSGTADDAVLLLRATADGELECTATLIAPNLAVTVLHCVSYGGAPDFSCTPDGELIPTPDGAGVLGSTVPPELIEFYSGEHVGAEPVARGARVLSTFSRTICKDDLAFVVLDRSLDLPVHPLRIDRESEVGEAMTFVGYGLDEDRIADFRLRPRKRLTGQRVLAIGHDSVSQGVSDAPPRTLVFEGPSACSGDSGGPALSEDTGAVAGVFSVLTTPLCSEHGSRLYYTHLAPYGALARAAFTAAGAPANFEPDPAACAPNAESCGEAAPRDAEPSSCRFGPVHGHGSRALGALGVLGLLWARRRALSAAPRADR